MEGKKEPCIKDVIEGAKATLKLSGRHIPQFIGIGQQGLIMAILEFGSDKEKDMAVEFVRGLVKKESIKRYWIVMEAWKSEIKLGEKMFRRAKHDIDRIECLIINEFTSDIKEVCICIPFRWEGKEVIFEEEQIAEGSTSIWNVYLEKEGIDERFDKSEKEVNEAFLRKLSHNVSEKYKKEFFDAKTPKERMIVLKKLIADGTKAILDQKKTMLEDPDLEDSDEKDKVN
jgi:hypothetical protein